MIRTAAALSITTFARALTGVRDNWVGCRPQARRRVYFANHCSHGDFILIWTVLPFDLRRRTRPVAGADYWRANALRRFVGEKVVDAVLIERSPLDRTDGIHPVEQMCRALDEGSSLIFFPEGTRNTTEERLLPFKSGLFHLAKARPEVEFVPVWIENLNRVMPKGKLVPVPLLCTVSFGAPVAPMDDEGSAEFLGRARDAMLALAATREART